MENIINFFKELFTKPQILWSVADKVVVAILVVIGLCFITVIILAICGVIDSVKKHKKGKKK